MSDVSGNNYPARIFIRTPFVTPVYLSSSMQFFRDCIDFSVWVSGKPWTRITVKKVALKKSWFLKKCLVYFSDRRGSHPSQSHPAEDIRIGQGLMGTRYFHNDRARSLSHYGKPQRRGISPGSVGIGSAEKDKWWEDEEGFYKAGSYGFNKTKKSVDRRSPRVAGCSPAVSSGDSEISRIRRYDCTKPSHIILQSGSYPHGIVKSLKMRISTGAITWKSWILQYFPTHGLF